MMPGGGMSPDQQAQMMIMQGVIQPMLNALFQSAFSPSSNGPSPEEIRRQREAALRAEAKKRIKRINELIAMNRKWVDEQKKRQRRVASLLAVDPWGGGAGEPETKDSSLVKLDLNTVIGNACKNFFGDPVELALDKGDDILRFLGKKGRKWGLDELAEPLAEKYENLKPALKIAVEAKRKGMGAATVKTYDWLVSLVEERYAMSAQVSEWGKKIYSKIAFGALDRFLEQTEEAAQALGFHFNRDEFMDEFESSMNRDQRAIYNWLRD
ncbi:MAG: hypothetical protein D6820_01945 [Lentisphaerae bacterium]|nr:MAG: hypothetical protein D6820_01945 [Lentisphaerota bacterium]